MSLTPSSTTNLTTAFTMSTMLSLQQHIEAESERWEASRQHSSHTPSITSSSLASSYADSIFSSGHAHNHKHILTRRSSTSSFATEFEPEPAQPFVAPRDSNGALIPVYASLEAAVAQSTRRVEDAGTGSRGVGGGGAGEGGDTPRRLVTPGKLYENEESDDEIVYA
ncbi:hypothetical protein F5Y19DRAFT_249589 [Xylariaceae sp. FL1651]|nr:hypothetical protein F5Y19DRAFT_249589 [Xylariaceae sp. FL1651]